MSTADEYRRVALHYLKLAEATSNSKTGASLLNLADYWVKPADGCAAREHQRSRATRRHAPVCGVIQLHLAPAAAAVMLLLLAGASVFAADGMAQDDVCTGSKPFREVAQDETRTMAELCAIQEERLREDRGWKDTPPVARRNGELRNGWAQGGNIQMRKR